jgi:hypothetical protein
VQQKNPEEISKKDTMRIFNKDLKLTDYGGNSRGRKIFSKGLNPQFIDITGRGERS